MLGCPVELVRWPRRVAGSGGGKDCCVGSMVIQKTYKKERRMERGKKGSSSQATDLQGLGTQYTVVLSSFYTVRSYYLAFTLSGCTIQLLHCQVVLSSFYTVRLYYLAFTLSGRTV